MLMLNRFKSVVLCSRVVFISGCQLATSTKSEAKFSSLDELKNIEFPSTKAPKGISDGPFGMEYDNGKPEFKTWIKKGCFDKYIKTYYENGNPESDIQLKDCLVNGTIRNYHKNGRIDLEMTVNKGKLSGPFTIFHDTASNKPNITGTFNNGVLVGTVTEFDENGTVTGRAVIRNGEVFIEQ